MKENQARSEYCSLRPGHRRSLGQVPVSGGPGALIKAPASGAT